ncbi:OB-fold nucleic acid binding domain-containing protein [Austwickia chelonae]|uniref:OB-fold nucleic acid binding domain-containing protein n=1 Tax=Austwickia chelonae TaxID=100225 RepID=UPI000E2800FB|nr:OB-fold nucleic acid binding domain-containing protein [Austwickia chelonae]
MGSVFSRFARRVTRSQEEEDADELVKQAQSLGAYSIKEVKDRGMADVCGELRSLTLPAHSRVPMLTAELYDGTATMRLVWLGRREVRGIEPGVRMRVRGRVMYRKGTPTVFNPQYELLMPRHGH